MTTATTVLVTGNTYPVKDQIKSLGGRWDAAAKGWRVPAFAAAKAQALVSGAGKSTYRPIDLWPLVKHSGRQGYSARHFAALGVRDRDTPLLVAERLSARRLTDDERHAYWPVLCQSLESVVAELELAADEPSIKPVLKAARAALVSGAVKGPYRAAAKTCTSCVRCGGRLDAYTQRRGYRFCSRDCAIDQKLGGQSGYVNGAWHQGDDD